jgi:hypothetical protein
MNTPLARLVTRTSNDEGTKTDLIIGSVLPNQNKLKPNTVYEIQECFLSGDLILKEVGESVMNQDIPAWNWSFTLGDIISTVGKYLFWTKNEFNQRD